MTEGGVLDGAEVLAIVPLSSGKIAKFPLRPAKNQPCKLKIQTHVASRLMSSQLHVIESEIQVPRFSGYITVEDGQDGIEPNSQVLTI
jgi:Ciliary BBSome complex subunit 2, C-terminal